ncbi:hypothetical protein I547_0041 [Mycobacterium kansasii 824]|nr:hypothetical protein I547_0041 [Mycobacterium kansasii 824]
MVGVGPSRESASIGFPLTRCVRRFGDEHARSWQCRPQ